MKKVSLIIAVIFLFYLRCQAQSNQTVINGNYTAPVKFTGTGCVFNWVNDNASIGLATSGTGNIAAFKAINTSNVPIKATITVTPEATDLAYLGGTKDIYVITTANNRLADTIDLDRYLTYFCAKSDGSTVYVLNETNASAFVIDPATNTITDRIDVPKSPLCIAISPDDKRLYIPESSSNSIAVISTVTNQITSFMLAGLVPYFVAVSPDGKWLYVSNRHEKNISVINAITGFEVARVPLDKYPGIIVVSPDGKRLYVNPGGEFPSFISNVTTTSVVNTDDYSVTSLPFSGGCFLSADGNKLYVYNGPKSIEVRNTYTYAIEGEITFNSLRQTGFFGQHAFSVNGKLLYIIDGEELDVIDVATNTIVAKVSIGINRGGIVVVKGPPCTSQPVTFTITVNPSPLINVDANLQPFTTVYGTPSTVGSFKLSGARITDPILITPPGGFEVSTDNVHFSPAATVSGSGTITDVMVYIRLAATTPVASYKANVVITSNGAPEADVPVNGLVTPAPLIITADNKVRQFGKTNPVFTATYTRFVNNESVTNLLGIPTFATQANIKSPVGQYAITVAGAASNNYAITYVPGTLTVTEGFLSNPIPNVFTPNNDGVNDTWNIKYLDTYPDCTVEIFNRFGTKVFVSSGYTVPWNGRYNGHDLPAGTYYYIIKLDVKSPAFSGAVTIIR